MKKRKDFFIALLILFGIPGIGYFALKHGEKERIKISQALQPKDSLSTDCKIRYANEKGDSIDKRLIDLPYTIEVLSTVSGILDTLQVGKILHEMNDREDVAFFLYSPEELLSHRSERIYNFTIIDGEDRIRSIGDIYLLDFFNNVIQIYDRNEPDLYAKLMADISFALPMVEFKKEKLKERK